MSLLKRRGQTANTNAPPGPSVPMYNPNQHSNVQWPHQEQQQTNNPWYNYSQTFQQPSNQENAFVRQYNTHSPSTQPSEYWQPPVNQQYAQNTNQYSQFQNDYSYGTNAYHQLPQQPNTDSFNNLNWGDEHNSNVQTLHSQYTSNDTNVNNTNQIGAAAFDNFGEGGGDDVWNWTVEDSNNAPPANLLNQSEPVVENRPENATNLFPKIGKFATDKYNSQGSSGAQKPEGKSDNLTPQWSIESQVSQDSSELSDKSHMLSRSSTISESPVSGGGHETYPEANTTAKIVEHSDHPANYYYQEHHENKEVLPNIMDEPPKITALPPLPPPKNLTPPLGALGNNDSSMNPYKRNAGSNLQTVKTAINNQASSKYYKQATPPLYPVASSPFNNHQANLEMLPDNSEQPDLPPHQSHSRSGSAHLHMPQQWPENNEIAAPINDRNQYLETGQLSSNNDYETTQNALGVEASNTFALPRNFPRKVVGQTEVADTSSTQDEPPPGLNRMVLGETSGRLSTRNEPPVGLHRIVPGESSSPEVPIYRSQQSNENSSDNNITQVVRSATIGADTSTASLLASSTTSMTNRSETIGADLSLPYSSNSSETNKTNRSASLNYNSGVRETHADGANNLDETSTTTNLPVSDRRDSIDGEPQSVETSLTNVIGSVRNLKINEPGTDGTNSNKQHQDRPARRASRQESTDDSESELPPKSMSKERKDRRYQSEKYSRSDRDKNRRRYSPSPDEYHGGDKYDRKRYKEKPSYEGNTTDYYSDKDKNRRRDERDRDEYDRKYSSLKRDKEKERKRRDHRSHRSDYSRDTRRNEYYSRYDDEYDNQTRPSSRSDSMHDSYRQDHRDRHRDRDWNRRHRDHFNSYMPGYSYDPYSYYQQHYQYYENLRRTNPKAYEEWYKKYYQQSGLSHAYGTEDRASVHSGRSSANDELAKERYTRQSYYSQSSLNYYREPNPQSISSHYGIDENSRTYDQTDKSYLEESTMALQRLTPAKFSTAHIKASIASGRLVKIFPNYPLDGQRASVAITNLHELLGNDDEYRELVQFPGPLVKGVTHKKTVIEYCENKIQEAHTKEISDVDSYILLWEYLILLLRQNGVVVGTDIAELLLKDRKLEASRRASLGSSASSVAGDVTNNEINTQGLTSDTNNSSNSVFKEEAVTNKFREFLVYGSGMEALEWAMKNGMWGHAFFLASKLDKRTYASVMTRFANGIPLNDPLQTLYQLLSGKVPVMCLADEKSGDWRPHLAMILSNTSNRLDIGRRSVSTLGDTLLNRGNLYGAQFCYLMAQVEFGCYGNDDSKLVLLGANQNKHFLEFSINEAIHMTEVYEYACSLNDSSFAIPEFQLYKYVLATRLADRGLLEKALLYLEQVSLSIRENPTAVHFGLITQVCELADRLKYYDPVEESFEGDLDTSRPDNSWLKDLKAIENDVKMGLIQQEQLNDNDIGQTNKVEQETWSHQYSEQNVQPEWQNVNNQPQYDTQQNQQNQLIPDVFSSEPYQQQTSQQYWPDPQLQQQSQWNENVEEIHQLQPTVDPLLQNNYWNAGLQQKEGDKLPDEDRDIAQTTLPAQTNYDNNEEVSAAPKKEINSPKTTKAPATSASSSGLFSKFFGKMFFPKNQMHLPDDKNPTFVWDAQRNAWVNTKEDEEGSTKTNLAPPPKMSDLMPKLAQTSHSSITSNTHQVENNINPTNQPIVNNQPLHQFQPQQQQLPFQQPQLPVQQQAPVQQQPHLQKQQQLTSKVSASRTPQAPGLGNTNLREELGIPAPSSQPNMFKLEKSRSIKKSYVDVFNPSGNKPSNATASNSSDSYANTITPQYNFFVPAPVTDPNAPTDFLTPAPVQQNLNDNPQ